MAQPDHSRIVEIEKRLKAAARKLHEMEGEMGMAITIIDYNTRRCDALLAQHAVKHIKAGESAAAADIYAKADEVYKKELDGLASIYEQAQVTKKAYENERTSWDTARSLLARARETLSTLPGTEDEKENHLRGADFSC